MIYPYLMQLSTQLFALSSPLWRLICTNILLKQVSSVMIKKTPLTKKTTFKPIYQILHFILNLWLLNLKVTHQGTSWSPSPFVCSGMTMLLFDCFFNSKMSDMSSISGWDRITCQWNNDDTRSVLDKHV